MTRQQLKKFFVYLKKKYRVYAPVRDGNELYVDEVHELEEVDFSPQIPINTYKHVLVPKRDELFTFRRGKLAERKEPYAPECGFLMSVMDLKAVGLFHQVFERDPYYQKKRQSNLLVGHAFFEGSGFSGHLRERYEEDILEHVIFDILLVKSGKNEWKVFTGSERGQETLDAFGFTAYEHIEFAGLIKEEGIDPDLERHRKQIVEASQDAWLHWGEICMACGKCAIDCPTCYCFNIADEHATKEKGSGKRVRSWTTCFYNDFSEIGGGEKFLKTNAQRIQNWYAHKWVRTPREFQIMGCVNCGRCDRVCPVGIKRADVFKWMDEHKDPKYSKKKILV
ncbi:MAG: 4Fe-4S dicluster domain-containing protein [Patescibacteria group bacterium]|nr:4Fe-4S dicluster domain-containing protein [Patescibacteria group bacterium]MDD5715205.1 4Fe-4S dicluster domain-containing protein [Patescibacteria group bacterium]